MTILTSPTEIHLQLNGYSWVNIYLFFAIVLVDEVITLEDFFKRGEFDQPLKSY